MGEADKLGVLLRELVEALRATGDEHWARSFQDAAAFLPGNPVAAAFSVVGNFGGAGSFNEWWGGDDPAANSRVETATSELHRYARQIIDGRAGTAPDVAH